MKPIYIKMKAFGSYVDETISFEKVNKGLFLITGDTGSGKTTIFDAITYALYGKTSGSMRNEKMMHSQYVKPYDITSVEYCFSYGENTYTVKRIAGGDDYTLNKKTGEYTLKKTPRTEKVELIYQDGTSYTGKDVNEQIESIIKLNPSQFKQVVMLAQGEFTELLKASSIDRQKIFTKIFDTTIYDGIERNSKQRYEDASSKLDENKSDISKNIDKIKPIEESKYYESWQQNGRFSESDKESLIELINNINDELSERISQIDNQIATNRVAKEGFVAKLSYANQINEKIDNLSIKNEQLVKLNENDGYINGLVETNKLARKANSLLTDFNLYQNTLSEIEENKKKISELQELINKATEALANFTSQKEKMESTYESDLTKLNNEMAQINNSLADYEVYDSLVKKIEDLMKDQRIAKKTSEDITKKLESITKKLEKLNKDQKELESLLVNSEVIELRIKTNKTLLDRLESLSKKVKDYALALKNIDEINTDIEQAIKVNDEAKQIYDEYYHKYIDNQVDAIRKTLIIGQPCPVCGNIHTSNINLNNSYREVSKEVLEEYKQEYERANSSLQDLYNELSNYKNSSQLLLNDIQYNKDIKYEGELVQFDELLNNKREEIVGIIQSDEKTLISNKENEKIFNENSKTIDSLTKDQNDEMVNKTNNDKELLSLEINIKNTNDNLANVKSKLVFESLFVAKSQIELLENKKTDLKNDYQKIVNNYQKCTEEMVKLTTLLSDQQDKKSDLANKASKQLEELNNQLSKNGFTSIAHFKDCLLDEQKIESYENTIKSHNNTKLELTIEISTLMKEASGKEKIDIIEIENNINEIDNSNKQLELIKDSNTGILAVNTSAYKNIVKLYDNRDSLIEDYQTIKDLYEVINGTVSKKHLSFKTYILRKYFIKMLNLANKRLIDLSNNQFYLKCKDFDDLSTRGSVGLDIDVINMITNGKTDAKSLSGGESFIAALSMALGMADLIQLSNGSVRIDTMFIDEGFGSLSDEIRDKAVNVLTELSDDNRLIGIISHVTELKHQVDTKLIIEKDDKGSHHRWEY